jgi:S-adenosylmethionine decarboxylase
MLELVNCKVLSIVESERVDAYLLSESSMFVFPHKLILKTCGTTTLLRGLPKILEIAAMNAGFPYATPNVEAGRSAAAKPYRVFYSRKNFKFPERQRGPHRSWRDEVYLLDQLFLRGSAYMIGKMNGEHWYLYLTEPNAILTPPATPTSERRETETRLLELPSTQGSLNAHDNYDDDQDETLEILMTDLDEETAKQFYLDNASAVAEDRYYRGDYKAHIDAKQHMGDIDGLHTNEESRPGNSRCLKTIDEEVDIFSNTSSDPADLGSSDSETLIYPEELNTEGHPLGTIVSESCGLSDVYPVSKYPDARIDAYMFEPCGFSANGVIPAPTGRDATHYFTVHVTPEPHCSYASFETNVPNKQTGRQTADVIEQVVNIFKPGRFSVTMFEGVNTEDDIDDNGPGSIAAKKTETIDKHVARKRSRLDQIPGYKRVERIVHDLEGYELVFKHYVKDGWKGGAPRLGEADGPSTI